MKKFIFLMISTMFLWSCNQLKDSTVYWHKKQVIEQIIKETDSVYMIHIGIMAQAFQLDHKNNTHYDEDLNLLNESLIKRTKLDIGIENGSNKIIVVKR